MKIDGCSLFHEGVDVSYEYYFGQGGYLAIAAYHKWLDDFVNPNAVRLGIRAICCEEDRQARRPPVRAVVHQHARLSRYRGVVAATSGKTEALNAADVDRGAEGGYRLLDGYRGYLMTDDYAGYNAVAAQEGIERLGCWAHARRKFVEAQNPF